MKLIFALSFCFIVGHCWFDDQYLSKNCRSRIVYKPHCIFYNWKFPSCVPWSSSQCEIL